MSQSKTSELKHTSSMRSDEQPTAPSWQWRAASNFTMGAVGLLCRGFLMGLSKTEVHGLDGFLELLDQREDVERRERGLITVSNHISVMDDPITWGILPIGYMFNVDNLRWGLGSYDLCFQNKALSTFFTLGQVLPTHRSAHSEHGGLFQPTMTQAIRLLSRGPFLSGNPPSKPNRSFKNPAISDPFAGGHLTFSTNGYDTFPSPSAYLNRRHSWVHIYPEGMIHQTQEKKQMRYFKWGVSRLILESDPIPDIVPMWIEGLDDVMDERRTFPRPLPRPFKNVSITFGEKLDGEQAFGDLRERWKQMRAKEERVHGKLEVGDLTDGLRYSEEAVSLRKECTLRVRQAVLNLRRARGYSEEDPKAQAAETWKLEGDKREGEKDDGSITKDT